MKHSRGIAITALADTGVSADTKGKGYTRIPQDPHKVDKLGSKIVGSTEYEPQPSDCLNYTMQAGYQHIKAYFDFTGVNFTDSETGEPFCAIDQLTGLCEGAVD